MQRESGFISPRLPSSDCLRPGRAQGLAAARAEEGDKHSHTGLKQVLRRNQIKMRLDLISGFLCHFFFPSLFPRDPFFRTAAAGGESEEEQEVESKGAGRT